MPDKKVKHLSEKQVVALWQGLLRRSRKVQSSNGDSLEVVYPGRPNDGRGADFRDAVVASSDKQKQGHIEVHSRTSGWQSHGHHLDPNYNQVILHVAFEQDQNNEIKLENGNIIPTIILGKSLQAKNTSRFPTSPLPCQRKIKPKVVTDVLEQAGDARFQIKASRFSTEIRVKGPAQAFYAGLMESLGYSQNQAPFRKLSEAISLMMLEEILNKEISPAEKLIELQSILLGRGGLLLSSFSPGIVDKDHLGHLERSWRDLDLGELCPRPSWDLFKVRPSNHPARRLLAFSHLVYRFREKGLLNSWEYLFREAVKCKDCSGLIDALVVTVPDCQKGDQALLGKERAGEILVNIILPFFSSGGYARPELEIGEITEDIYRRYPRLAFNSIDRHMLHQLSLKDCEINSVRRQQGLLHLYKTLCIQGKCGDCDLGV